MPHSHEEYSGIAREATDKLDQGRKLVKERRFEEALECYLFAFDNREEVECWGGVAYSYIPAEIAEMGEKYPPAKQALIKRRDECEKELLGGNSTYVVQKTWTTLNQYLQDSDHELQVFERLESEGCLDKELRKRIIESQFDRLLKDRKYDLISPYIDDFVLMFRMMSKHCDYSTDDEPNVNSHVPNSHFRSMSRLHCRNQAAKLLELALATSNKEQTITIMERVLRHCPGRKSTIKLIYAAKRSGKPDFALHLLEVFSEQFSETMSERLKEIIDGPSI